MVVVLGIGCSSTACVDDFNKAMPLLVHYNITAIATLNSKASHQIICYAAKQLSCPILSFSVQQLEQMTPFVKNPSKLTFDRIGCHSVAEAAALAAFGKNGELILEKTKLGGISLAIARTIS